MSEQCVVLTYSDHKLVMACIRLKLKKITCRAELEIERLKNIRRNYCDFLATKIAKKNPRLTADEKRVLMQKIYIESAAEIVDYRDNTHKP